LGVSIEEDILRNFGEDGFGAYLPVRDSGDLEQVAGIKVRDPEAMTAALDALLAMIGDMSETSLFVPHEVEGATVYVMRDTDLEGFHDTVSYTLAHGYLLIGIGSPNAMEAMLKAMNKPGKPIWERADVKKHLAGMPEDAYIVAYYDLPQLLSMVYDKILAEFADDEELDLGELPPPGTLSRYFGAVVEFATKTPEGLFGSARLFHAEP
jgi:hypothetical protein